MKQPWGGWRYASEEGPGAVLSGANGGVPARGVGKEAVDPRAGRNQSRMIRTPRVRAADLDRDQAAVPIRRLARGLPPPSLIAAPSSLSPA